MWQNVRARVPATTTGEGSSPVDERIGAQLPGLKKSVSHLQEKVHIFQYGFQGPPLSKCALCLYSESLLRFLPYSSPTQTLHACRRWRMYFHFNPDILNLPLDFLHQCSLSQTPTHHQSAFPPGGPTYPTELSPFSSLPLLEPQDLMVHLCALFK